MVKKRDQSYHCRGINVGYRKYNLRFPARFILPRARECGKRNTLRKNADDLNVGSISNYRVTMKILCKQSNVGFLSSDPGKQHVSDALQHFLVGTR